ncbi:MAG: germination protein YpeB [Clostridia bacterium]|nr:germination protein YpeB [Clostridia bacterium]
MEKKENRRKTKKGVITALAISTGILGATTLGFGIAYGVANTQANEMTAQLEGVYKKNYYELVDNANSCDTNISKLLASSDESYRAKMLNELSQSAKEMQISIASLPLSSNGIAECVGFINQMSGYTQTLEEKLSQGGNLTDEDLAVLDEMHKTLNDMKEFLNDMSTRMIAGYSITTSHGRRHGDYDEFSWEIKQINPTDYPTMIYDGPFSDSVVNQKIKGLTGEELSKDEVYKKVDEAIENIANMQYIGQTKGKFDTYNFKITNTDGQDIYVQATKIGGHILTISGHNISESNEIDRERAEQIAINFAEKNDIENCKVVWSQELNSQMYLNLAPTQNGVILYPDIVKVKIDLQNGNVIGFDAISYYTNHTDRDLPSAKISAQEAREQIDESFIIKNERLTLSPLDFNREVLCYEFECLKNNATFYFYVNAQSGKQENILKVVETSDGNKLM